MTKFAKLVALTATTVALAGTAHASLEGADVMPFTPEAQPLLEVQFASARPPSSFQGNWYIAPNGCAYSKTQAPGSPARWFLIQNPHHLGLPAAHSGCSNTL